MKTNEITFGPWSVTCEESMTDPHKMWTVYTIDGDLSVYQVASGIYNFKDAKAIQSIPEMLSLLESFVHWYPEISDRMSDAENAVFRIMVDRAIQIIDK